ncbi:kunitz-type serine protease inhibitor vestiginin-7 [Drosophila hydei]|uniref:Kunitz-type serine protease inhibitor vestiginin-7 n=1 Tax=Drosophila hydei TaxID=7224 RepID=A0A6J1LYI3_DROHY|nr:kunitz-type serine protease inhibitor vestiginin-7 [Drosophila hydei]
MKRMTRVTQFLCLAAIIFLGLTQLAEAVTTTKPKPLAQAQPQVVGTTSSTTAKPIAKQQPTQPQRKQDVKCLQPLETGPCRMSLERFYYNKEKNSCETFKYGGCKGNDNRWGFRQTCEEACLVKK